MNDFVLEMDSSEHALSAWQHGLPMELWISEVFPHLDPLDVMTLGLVCFL